MKIKTVVRWLFVYLPVRFTVPFVGLLAWYFFYIWPWLIDLFFPDEDRNSLTDMVRKWFVEHVVPDWIHIVNLDSAATAAAVLLLLAAGILVIYNIASVWYQVVRRWSRERLLVGTLLLNIFIYAYPWLLAPKDWSMSEGQWRSWMPFFLNADWSEGFPRYGILWFLPALNMIGTLAHELYSRTRTSVKVGGRFGRQSGALPPVDNMSFETLLKDGDLRIGLILSGGGAKGVYQAGAMKAIHEFLKRYDSLGKVKMIAGTSIGSWNSMFWLADLVGADPGKTSVHEQWWQTTNVARIIAFNQYLPFLQNYMLNNRPWRENFEEIFSNSALKSTLQDRDAIHFYLTRSNVAQGRLEFTTNWGPEQRERALQSEDVQVDSFTEAQQIEDVREAVFASMDLPPLFQYQRIGYEYFEDGGVIDNLPLRFGTLVEKCDLLFVLALNASFQETPSQHSIIRRLTRVNDVRQGVLERNSMRLVYLYNHINMLTQKGKSPAAKSGKIVRVFAICPQQPLLVNTGEFWKSAEFGQAFDTMYQATRVELSRFNFAAIPAVATDRPEDWLRMALVSAAGEITYNYRF
jgi:predicted acylesterase/phospholipase RssA